MHRILHITAHMGGGVGKALSDISVYQNNNDVFYNKIIILDKPQKTQFIDKCIKNSVEVAFIEDINIKNEIENAEIVIIDWWNNPIMCSFLYNFPHVKTRIIVWSHVSGCNYPMLPFNFIKSVNKVFFATKYTLDNPYWKKEEQEYAKKCSSIVYGIGQNAYINNSNSKKKVKTDKFNVGYVGTLNKSKINEKFVHYCQEVVKILPEAYFIMVGDFSEDDDVYKEVIKCGMKEKFEFVGYTDDVQSQFDRFDVFGYPLNAYHFGASENVLLEAMTYKVPIVALNQCTEKYIINNMQTGLLAKDEKDYAQKIKYLADNEEERIRISENAWNSVLNDFSFEDNINRMESAYREVIKYNKTYFDFRGIFGDKPYKWFLACLGNDRKIFEESIKKNLSKDKRAQIENKIKNCREILKGKSKSSVYHFYSYYAYDNNLKYWYDILQNK